MRSTTFTPHYEFLAPEFLLLIPVAFLLGLFGWWAARARRRARACLGFNFYADLPLLIFSPIIVTLLLALALARPSIGTWSLEVPRRSHALFVVVDVSTSMLAADAIPNRIEFTKRKLLDLFTLIEKQAPQVKIGLVLFSGAAAMYCPSTSDFEILRLYTRELSPDLLSTRGTDIQSALRLISETASKMGIKSYSTAIFSDGEFSRDTTGVGSVKPIFTFGVGATSGTPIPLPNGSFQKDENGDIVVTRLKEDALRSLARETDGEYWPLQVGSNELSSFVSYLEKRTNEESSEEMSQFSQKAEVFHYFAIALLLFVLFHLILPLRGGVLFSALIAGLLLCSPPPSANAQTTTQEEALQAYKNGDFKRAEGLFLEALRKNEKSDESRLGHGSALYQQKKYEEAQKAFSLLAEDTKQGRIRFQALYNAGNSALAAGAPAQAISHYEEALRIKPEDERARHNLEIARRLKEEKEEEEREQEQEEEEEKEEDKEKEEEEGEEKKREGEQGASDEKREESSEGEGTEEKSESEEMKEGEEKPQQGKEDSSPKSEDSEEEPSPADGDNSLPEGQENEQKEGAMSKSENELKTPSEMLAARKWIDSLPQSPVLLPRYETEEAPQGGQTW